MTRRFHLVTFDDDQARGGLAHGPYSIELLQLLGTVGPIEWTPLAMELELGARPVPDGRIPDDVGLWLCSPRLREVLDAGGRDIRWLEVTLTDPAGEVYDYFSLHPTAARADVLHPRSYVAEDVVGKPVLDAARVEGRDDLGVFVFTPGGDRVVVSEEVRRAIVDAGCTGMAFTPLETAG